MQGRWQQWNRILRRWLWALAVIGVLAALPLGAVRYGMEKTSKQVEYVFDYRDLQQIASYQAHPDDYLKEQLARMKEAGITTMAVYESTLEELVFAGRITMYNSAQVAWLEKQPAPLNENYAYVLFADETVADALRPLIAYTFGRAEIAMRDWSFGGRPGVVLETPVENAVVKTMAPDPITLRLVREHGLQLLPRLSDRIQPYDPEYAAQLVEQFAGLGVKRILFEGDSVTGYSDDAAKKSLTHFANLLHEHGIGIAAIENIKAPQNGIHKLAYLTDYNVARLYSLSELDAARMKPDAIVDRFLLAAKDRNIRMFYLNGAPARDINKGKVTDPLENLYTAVGGDKETVGAIERLGSFGFPAGSAQPFDYGYEPWQKALKAVVALGAVAIIALLAGAFLPLVLLPVFALGLVGSAGLYVLSSSLLEQGLALGAAIAAPTLAMIWVIGRIRAHTEGDRRTVGGEWANAGGGSRAEGHDDRLFGGQWLFPKIPVGRRLTMALGWFFLTSLLSLFGAAFVFGLLGNITYSLVLQQFRGVSLLHLAPLALVALYLFLYTGHSPLDNLRKLLRLRITVLGVLVAAVLGVVGLYYLSRTGNAGQASALELMFRNALESTFGVRPRFKEFMIAHPLFLLGLFLSLRYRAAWVLMIVAAMGQLSLVDTFAHIHTPILISLIRVLLGLGLGAVIGLVLIAAWQLAEGAWRWAAGRRRQPSA